jgi:hypothetical protein
MGIPPMSTKICFSLFVGGRFSYSGRFKVRCSNFVGLIRIGRSTEKFSGVPDVVVVVVADPIILTL